jgi:outer membrane murein-binding lipoprotein Lpp
MPKQHEDDPIMSYAQIQSQLHELSGSVGGLKSSVELMTKVWQQQEVAATAGRQRLHEKVDSLKTDVHGLKNDVDQVKKELAAVQPAVERFKGEELRAAGARSLGKRLWGLILVAVGFTGWWAHEFIPILFHRPPPTP